MGLFSRKPKETRVTVTAEELGGGDFFFHFVGESFCQAELRKIQKAVQPSEDGEVRFTVALIPEPNNKYDPNAIAVYAHKFGMIGHFAREDAAKHIAKLRRLGKTGKVGSCEARLIGEDKEFLGVLLDFKWENLGRH